MYIYTRIVIIISNININITYYSSCVLSVLLASLSQEENMFNNI